MVCISQTTEHCKEVSQKLSGFCKEFGVCKLLKRFGAGKARGVPFGTVFNFVFALVFTGRNLFGAENAALSKDTVYRFLNNAKINWEKVLLSLAVVVIRTCLQ